MSRNPTTHRLPLAGKRSLSARVWPGEGVPVVLLHGIFASSTIWAETCAALDRPCVAFDLPGFGDSDLPAAADVSAYAADVAAGLEQLGVDRFELVGHSFGGAVAARLAQLVPAKVISLILFAPAGFGRIAMAEAIARPGIGKLAESLVRRSLARRQIVLTERAIAGARIATAALVAAGKMSPATPFAAPVTAVWGTDDRVVRPRHRRGVATAFPHAEVVLLEGMGHHPLQERPAAVRELLATGCRPRRIKRVARQRRRLLWPLPTVRPAPRFA